MQESIRNIGILAHVDAGKTSVTENFLYIGGKIKTPGSVDNGTAQTDFLDIERERGISIKSAFTTFEWKNTQINLVDTPGHVDFSSETERVLRIIDGAILIVSAVEGVQAHTETLWLALKERNIPVIFFINKIDRPGADVEAVIMEIEKNFKQKLLSLSKVEQEGNTQANAVFLWREQAVPDWITESIALTNENILEKYLTEGALPFVEQEQCFAKAVQNRQLFPVIAGSAKNAIGIKNLLDTVVALFPPPVGNINKPLSALVYSIDHDKVMGKVANVKVFNGSISNRELIKNQTRELEEKVTQVRRQLPRQFEDIGKVSAGDIAGICGLSNAQVGDILGQNSPEIPETVKLHSPLLTVQVKAENSKDYPALAEALHKLSLEDPTLGFEWLREEQELYLNIMGWIQMEVLEKTLESRFNIKAKFDSPTVIYKETPATTGEGFVQYWMPKPCWAILKFLIEPGKRGSGVVYQSTISVNDVHKKYQNEVERTIPVALKQGIKGWEVTDIKITLIEGEDHEVHSRPGDFIVATPMGIMNGLVNTSTTLLEPIIEFRISAPEDLLGVITSDITQLRGSFESPDINNGIFTLQGLLPVASSLDFPIKLSSRSGGKAKISTRFHGYAECPDELGVTRPYKGISPLDTSKYILKARKALQ